MKKQVTGFENGFMRLFVTYLGALANLHELGAEIIEARIVGNSDIVATGGVTPGIINLALHIVNRESIQM